ncbi:branched-chain amino acid ABC transporter permease [Acuticoccus mangrovi]|uniref:Branched-chain amino acid ABC transporter permease n=1 Tax=Acuticoccus mangrovi TaxID=2796142 RepID=A0A934IL39_9HYPH|nr:branched-chain amino acid ABC transporter permease [Acuticoccus mangrovi]
MDGTNTLVQLVIAGLSIGSIYALIALGFNIVFKCTGAMNFAQGEWVMMGGMVTAALFGVFSSVGLAVVTATVLIGAIGLVSERITIWPVRRPDPMTLTLVTVGLAIVSRSLVMIFLGKMPAGYSGFSGTDVISIEGVTVQTQSLWIIAITLLFLVLMHFFFERTVLGKALRAVSADPQAASLVGIPSSQMLMLAFGLAALAGGIAGAIVTPLTLMTYDQGATLGFKGFSAAMLGGIGNLPGAVVGGLLLGLIETFGSFYISSHFKDAISFAVLLLILFMRPAGLFGRVEVVKA